MKSKLYFLRKPGEELVVGPLPESRISDLLLAGKVQLSDEVSEDQTVWSSVRDAFPAEAMVRESPGTTEPIVREERATSPFAKGHRVCNVCGNRLLPKQSRCNECNSDPTSPAAVQFRRHEKLRNSAGTARRVLQANVRVVSEFDAPVLDVCISSDGSLCLAQLGEGKSADGKRFQSGVCLLDLRDGKPLIDERSRDGGAMATAFSPDDRLAAIAWYKPRGLFRTSTVLTIIDLDKAGDPTTLHIKGQCATRLGFSADGQLLHVAEAGGTIRTVRRTDGKCVRRFKVAGQQVEFCGGGRVAVVGSRKGRVWCWDLERGRLIREFRRASFLGAKAAHMAPVNGVAAAAGGRYVASCSGSGYFAANSGATATGALLSAFTGDFSGLFLGFFAERDGKSQARKAQARETQASLWDTTSGEELLHLDAAQGEHSEGVSCVALSEGRRHMATGCFDGAIRVWDIDSKRCIDRSPRQDGGIRHVAFAANGKVVFSHGDSPSLKIWTPRQRLNSTPVT